MRNSIYSYCGLFLVIVLIMKVLFPRHIKKGIFASMNFTIWPITVSLIQLFVLALGLAGSFWIANYFLKQGQNKVIAIIFASPLFLISLAIAFFEISEMNLLQFIGKMLRTYFFDTTEKYQVNVTKTNIVDLTIKKNHGNIETQKITFKTEKKFLSDSDTSKVIETSLL